MLNATESVIQNHSFGVKYLSQDKQGSKETRWLNVSLYLQPERPTLRNAHRISHTSNRRSDEKGLNCSRRFPLAEFPNFEWMMKKNHHNIEQQITNRRPHLLPYLEDLSGFLRNKGASRVQERMSYADNFHKLWDTISEFKVGRLLIHCGKKVTFDP